METARPGARLRRRAFCLRCSLMCRKTRGGDARQSLRRIRAYHTPMSLIGDCHFQSFSAVPCWRSTR